MEHLKTYEENSLDNQLQGACEDKSKNVKLIRDLLKAGAKITKQCFRDTIINNKIRSVKDILDTGWNPSRADLETAINSLTINPKIVKYLLEAGAPLPKAQNIARFMYFMEFEKVELLIDYDYDFMQKVDGKTLIEEFSRKLSNRYTSYNKSAKKSINNIINKLLEKHPDTISYIKGALSDEQKEKYKDLIDSEELGLI